MTSELSEGHRKKLNPTAEVANLAVSALSVDTFIEFVAGDELKKLSKNGFVDHGYPRQM